MTAMLECSHRDIVAARTLHNEIKNLLKAHGRGEGNDAVLRDIKVLCSIIIQTIRDPNCQERMCEVEIHSDELFAVDKRPRWGRGAQPGSMFLRRLIFKSLEAFDDRLKSLETARQSGHGASGTPRDGPSLSYGS
jgi:hypothetical protein